VAVVYLLEYSRPAAAISCDGEPAPDLGATDILFCGLRFGDRPKGERTPPPDGGSIGEVAVGEPDWPVVGCGG
jgi:hypothetical protein